jgi:transposase
MHWIGVDCHKWQHTAVILDVRGQVLAHWQGGTCPKDWQALHDWAASYGGERRWGIEGSGHFGRGLAQLLVSDDEWVAEVNTRLTVLGRQSQGSVHKSDLRDAAAIAAIVRQQGERLPRIQREDASVALAFLTQEREDLQAAATRLGNQLHGLLQQAEPGSAKRRLRERRELARWQTYQATSADALSQARAARIRSRTGQLAVMLDEIESLGQQIAAAAVAVAGPLTDLVGVGWLTAGMLAGYLGPGQRFASDAQLATYAGAAPREVSSAGRQRHRLNRTGHRQLNAILHRIARTQKQHSPEAQTYLARRMREGKSEAEALRALKRYIARRIYRLWQQCLEQLPATTMEAHMT